MTFKSIKIYNFLMAVVLGITLCSCRDDFGYGFGEVGDGETLVTAEVNFKPLASADLTTRTAGNVVKNVEHLWLLIYTPSGEGDGTLYGDPIELNSTEHGLVINQAVDRNQVNQAETQTPQAKFKLRLPYGRYQMIVVANMPDLPTKYAEEIQHYNDLRNITLNWNTDVKENKQMFGFLTFSNSTTANVTQSEAPELVLNQPGVSLHGWMERVVSKLTVSFDASNLKHQVSVYIKSVQIKNISSHVKLGRPSYASTTKDVITNGEKVEYKEDYPGYRKDDDNTFGLYLSNNPELSQMGSDHSEAEPRSLFFFENDQHIPKDGRTEGKYKAQDGNNDGVVDFPNANAPEYNDAGERNPHYDYRCDGVPCGTWVEVQGYYVSQNPGRPGKGSIIYRFMLGEDTKDNFSVFRNKHYKLTMKFNGYANDIDWHIEYTEEDPSIQVKTPQYISYLYNSDMQVSVKLKGCDPNTPLKATIIQNRWYPDEGKGTTSTSGTGDVGDYFSPAAGYSYGGKTVPGGSKGDENGFLSLRSIPTDETGQGATSANTTANYDYYTTNLLYTREYDISTLGTGKDKDKAFGGAYDVSDVTDADGKTARKIDLPFYTRERVMTERTGYTGTNPFFSLHRVAKVRFEAKGWNGTTVSTEIVIKQVPRIDNPKGIYRSVGSSTASGYFDVHLLQWTTEPISTNVGGSANINFSDFKSDGAWQAVILKGADWFTLEPGDGSADKFDGGKRLLGYDGTSVKFRWQPTDLSGPHYGLIEVRYHNMSCTHIIVVRCGNEPVKLLDSQTVKWHYANVKTMVRGTGQTGTTYGNFVYTDAADPRDEGGLFRWGCPDGIDATQLTKQMFNQGAYFKSRKIKTTTGAEKDNWAAIKPVGYSAWNNKSNGTYGKTRPASYSDFQALRAESRKAGGKVHFSYGALYYDGMTLTLSNYHDAYMFRGGPSQTVTGRGMRGIFIYNEDTGKNIFFPLGATGWGRLMSDGTLRYGFGTKGTGALIANTTTPTRPLLYKLYLQFGCVYWFNEKVLVPQADQNNWGVCFSWEFNYSTFNSQGFGVQESFGGTPTGDANKYNINLNPTFSESDAAFIRCVTAD